MNEDFEERHGWAPDSDYEIIRTNDPDGTLREKIFEECMSKTRARIREIMSRENNE